jgi:hypothetical protein
LASVGIGPSGAAERSAPMTNAAKTAAGRLHGGPAIGRDQFAVMRKNSEAARLDSAGRLERLGRPSTIS